MLGLKFSQIQIRSTVEYHIGAGLQFWIASE